MAYEEERKRIRGGWEKEEENDVLELNTALDPRIGTEGEDDVGQM